MVFTTATFTLCFILSCILINASVISTQTDDLISVNERLYDPDLYGSVYQETSKKKRLYLAPGLSKLEKALDNGSFDLEILDTIPHSVEEGFTDIEHTGDLLNVDRTNLENTFEKASELGLMPKKNKMSFKSETFAPRKFTRPRSLKWPVQRRTWSKLVGRQGKRYKAGVADRIAHGFGKRAAVKTVKLGESGDVSNVSVGNSRHNDEKSYKGIAEIIWHLAGNKDKTKTENNAARNPDNKSIVDLINDILVTKDDGGYANNDEMLL